MTVPEVTVPKVTVPEVTVPEVTVPEVTVPEVTVPEAMVPKVTVPEVTVPEVTVPEVAGHPSNVGKAPLSDLFRRSRRTPAAAARGRGKEKELEEGRDLEGHKVGKHSLRRVQGLDLEKVGPTERKDGRREKGKNLHRVVGKHAVPEQQDLEQEQETRTRSSND